MKVEKFSDVTILYFKKITISKFKKGQRKIRKFEYRRYDYDWAINLGLFYIAFSKRKHRKGWALDINSKIGLIRIMRRTNI